MKYKANPVAVEAFRIVSVRPPTNNGTHIILEDGRNIIAEPPQVARMQPTVGDYWVTRADGYCYIEHKGVFESGFGAEDAKAAPVAAGRKTGITGRHLRGGKLTTFFQK